MYTSSVSLLQDKTAEGRLVMKEGKHPVPHHIGEEEVFLTLLEGYDRISHEIIPHHMDEGEVFLKMGEEGAHKKKKPITHHLDEGDVFASMIH